MSVAQRQEHEVGPRTSGNLGDFALDPGFTPPKRVMVESSEALLLEGMRRMDEGI